MAQDWPMAPMKAVSGRLPGGDEWAFEPKWDGHRAMVRVSGGRVAIASSTGKDRTESWRWLIEPISRALGDRDAIVDGEIIALDDSGRHSFQLVGRPDRPHSFVAFDLLALDGRSLTGRPWGERRELLEASITAGAPVSITPVDDDAETLMAVTRAHGFEGVVAKRRSSTYQPGRRSPSWIKVKHRHEQEFVVGGYKTGDGNRAGTFGSLLLGVYDGDGRLQFAGAAGTGFDERLLTRITPMLRSREIPDCPFVTVPRLPGGRDRLRWVRPELVAQVSFAEWTEGGGIRHSVFLGLRDDKPADEVVREA